MHGRLQMRIRTSQTLFYHNNMTTIDPLTANYLNLYQQLQQKQHSKKANRLLLEIEESQQAWNVASELIRSENIQTKIHGAQLLSKKLNAPPPLELNLQSCLEYLLAVSNKNALLWLCTAKTIVHISPKQPYLPQNLSLRESLKLIKQIPAALSHVRTRIPLNSMEMKTAFLTACMPLLKEGIKEHSQLVLQVLDGFVSYGARIKDQTIVEFLLGLPLEAGGKILEEIISQHSFLNLIPAIIQYLSQYRQDDSSFNLHVAFLKQNSFKDIQFEDLKGVMAYVLTCLSQQDKEASNRLTDSYELWNAVAKQYTEEQIPTNIREIVRDGLLTVWNLTLRTAMLHELPSCVSFAKTDPLSLSQDLDDSSSGDELARKASQCQANNSADFFRQYAGDFLVLCLQTLAEIPEAVSHMIAMGQTLASSEQLLHMELAIFVAYSISIINNPKIVKASASITRVILSRATQMNEYLCSKVIDLIGQMSNTLAEVPDLVLPTLMFLSKCLQYPELSVRSSASLCNLLESVDSTKTSIADGMQEFLNHAYQVLFKDDLPDRVVEYIARAMVIFIYKFRQSVQDYANYLQTFQQQLQEISKEKRRKLVEASITGQLYINSQETRRDELNEDVQISAVNQYMVPFGEYLEKQVPLLSESVASVEKKKIFSEGVVLINLAMRTMALGDGQIWSQLCDYLLSTCLHRTPPMPVVITPLMNFVKIAYDTNFPYLVASSSVLLKKWWQPITNLLDFSFLRHEFSLSSIVLNLHVKIVQLIRKHPHLKEELNYQPEIIVNYIISLFSKRDIWEYEAFNNSLNYLNLALQLGYPPLPILTCLLNSFGKLQETLWHSLNTMLTFIYKNYGFDMFAHVLGEMGSTLADEGNPLRKELEGSFEKGESKNVKNLLMSL